MKNHPPLSALLAAVIALLTFVSASAQEQLAAFNEREGAQPVRLKRPSVVRLEAMKADMTALQKRRAALRTYLASTEPGSADRAATQRSLVELEVKLQDMARDIVRLGTAVGTQPVVAAPAPLRATPAPVRAIPAPEPVRATPADDTPAPAASGGPAATAQSDSLAAVIASADRGGAEIDVDITRFPGTEVQVEARDSGGVSLSKERYVIGTDERRAGAFRVSVPIAASGATTVIVTSLDSKAPTAPVAVTIPEPARPAVARPADGDAELTALRKGGPMGLMVGGMVVSQQAQNFNQADPFFGFIAGYDSKFRGNWQWHLRFQGIFTASGRKAQAMPAAAGGGGTGGGDSGDSAAEDDPFKFIASRKTFDVDAHGWIDLFATNPLSVGPYFAWGASATMDKNELQGEPVIADEGNDEDTIATQSTSDNDLKQFREAGMIINLKMGDRKKLFLQAILAKGWYEALKDLDRDDDTRNRFIGKLRVFPEGLSFGFGNKVVTPMFGVDLNAGTGPDQIKFFSGFAVRLKGFSLTGK